MSYSVIDGLVVLYTPIQLKSVATKIVYVYTHNKKLSYRLETGRQQRISL